MRMGGKTGFSLLEVVVSLAVLSIGLAMVMQVFSGGFGNMRRIDLAHRAMSHGENVMSRILTDGEITGPTSLVGDLDEEFSYSVDVGDFETASSELTIDAATPTVRLLKIAVRINFKNDRFGKFYQLNCLKAVSLVNQPGGTVQNPIEQLFSTRSQPR